LDHEPNSLVKLSNYASIVGSLQYAATSTRPDIAHAVNTLAGFNSNPRRVHLRAVKRILRYLAGTRSIGLTYRHSADMNQADIGPVFYTDSDWASDKLTRRSVSGYTGIMCGAAVTWASKKQQTVALSSAEAEYVAATETTKEILWLRGLLSELGFVPTGPTRLNIDSQSALAMGNGTGSPDRRKHIDVKHHFITQCTGNGTIKLVWVPTQYNVADILTKPLSEQKFIPFCSTLLGQSPEQDNDSKDTSAGSRYATV
jgi:hypothetical protein